MVGVNIVANVQEYRRMLEYNLREREKFDSENSHQNLTTRHFMHQLLLLTEDSILM